MDQIGTFIGSAGAEPSSGDLKTWRRAVEFARSHIAESLDASGPGSKLRTVEARLAKWLDDFAATMEAPTVAHMIAGLDDQELDRLLNLCLTAVGSSSGAIVEQMLAAVYAKKGSPRPLIDLRFNEFLHMVIDALNDIACAIIVLPRRRQA